MSALSKICAPGRHDGPGPREHARSRLQRSPGAVPPALIPALAMALAVACSNNPGGGQPDGSPAGVDGGPGSIPDSPDGGAPPDAASGPPPLPVTDQELETAAGCPGVYNPDQMLDYHFDMDPGDWNGLLADQSNTVYFPAQLRCGDEAPITVGLRRKRSGGAVKVGLKVDMNQMVPGQTYYGLKKLSLENGVSEGGTEDDAEVSVYLSEYLAWRMMVLSGTTSGRAVFARVHVNGALLGVYVNVEQIDKRFLASRLGDDSGWLYKHSGSSGDGFKTHENDGLSDPYADFFCFWETGGSRCEPPDAGTLLAELPARLDIQQMLRMGAVNALMANSDSPLFKDNNYYWYDRAGGRVYLPWDLDTAMNGSFDVFLGDGIGGRTSKYTDVLFTHWEQDYDTILTELLAGPLGLDAIRAELVRAEAVAGSGFASDPYVNGTMADAVSRLDAYWTQRHAEVQAQVQAH